MRLSTARSSNSLRCDEKVHACLIFHEVHPLLRKQTAAKGLRQSTRVLVRCAVRTGSSTLPSTSLAATGTRKITGLVRLKNIGEAQEAILDALSGVKGRGASGLTGQKLEQFEKAVAVLEASGGVKAPTDSPQLIGKWKLLFTTRPGTASPIQRTFTGVDGFKVFQEISVDSDDRLRISNIVDFGQNVGYLKVEAEGNTDSRPIPGFVPRQGAGIALFGKSSTYPPERKDLRIDFQFDVAAFTLRFLPFKVPYPVPFKLLGDETKGWLDVTYLAPDGSFRISRGNKGTLFVLAQDKPPREQMLAALDSGNDAQVLRLVDELAALGQKGGEGIVRQPAQSDTIVGTWKLRWAMQASDANPLQRALSNSINNYNIITAEGRLTNLVDFAPFLKVRAGAACDAESPTRTSVRIDEVLLELGPLKVPLPVKASGAGYVDWLYLDDTLRVTRGNKGSIFIHTRVEE